jgi:hypothetical protein
MVWAVVKVVDGRIIGCMVGPFATEHAAIEYTEKASKFSLGYENWVVRELEQPSEL